MSGHSFSPLPADRPAAESEAEVLAFLADKNPDKRTIAIQQLLNDERCADHFVSEWLDLLAENPTLLNQSQGSTGPFRFFLHDSLRDRKPLDRLVTELILMRGGQHEGGSAGFAMAAENDAPFAAKGHIVASAFLGIELQCARCHDSPYHDTTQRDLFTLAAMFQRKPASAPTSSQVPVGFFEGKQGTLDAWLGMVMGGLNADVLFASSSGRPEFFELAENTRGHAVDIPILQKPLALQFIHSFSLRGFIPCRCRFFLLCFPLIISSSLCF